MAMATIITVLSSDDEDVQFIEEKRREVKIEPKLNRTSVKIDENGHDDLKPLIKPDFKKTATTFTSVIRSTCKSPPPFSIEEITINGDHPSDPENEPIFICLDDENDEEVEKNVEENVRRSSNSREKPEVITLDDDGEKEQEIESEGSSRSSVILIGSEDESEADDLAGGDDHADAPAVKEEKIEDAEATCEKSIQLDEDTNQCSGDSNEVGGGLRIKDKEDVEGGGSDLAEANKVTSGPPSPGAGPSSSKADPGTSKLQIEIDISGPGNLTEKLLKQLISVINQVGFSQENFACVKKKIMKYYNNSAENFTQSEEFVDKLKSLIVAIGKLMELPNTMDRLTAISNQIHEFLTVFKRGSTHLSSHLIKLYKTLEKLSKRIAILENKEVESDDEYENPYVMLDRYRKRAVEVYDKICQLENKSNHADRMYKREFIYAQGVGPVPVQRAIERYYNKTKKFPDFFDVYDLVKRENRESDLKLKPAAERMLAEQIFVDFGKKLKRRRQYDDFSISRSYLPESSSDPAEHDASLREKLEMNRRNAKKEEDVLREFAMKEAAMKESNKPAQDDSDNCESEADCDDEAKVKFVDSDEEIANLEKPPDQDNRPEKDHEKETTDTGEEDPPSKKRKLHEVPDPVSPPANGTASKRDTEPDEAQTKDSYMSSCGLQPK